MSSAPPNPEVPDPGIPGEPRLADTGAEWLRGEGEASDVVMSSRVRLARNIEGFAFASKLSKPDRQKVIDLCRECVLSADLVGENPRRLLWVDLHNASPLERALLMERHLISKQHSTGRGGDQTDDPRGVAVALPDERLSIMVNEEDHLRVQAIRSGLALTQAWQEASGVDDKLEARLDFAFSTTLGYLTACPTNVGTGLRMSAMLHLPGLRLTGEIDKVKRAAQDMSLAVRGFYGEGSDSAGDLFQISNQTTLGRSEETTLHQLEKETLPRVIEYERQARKELFTKRRIGLEDQVFRAWGVLTGARLLTTEEAMQALSLARLGVVLGIIRVESVRVPASHTPAIRTMNQLMLLVQPAHLQRAVGKDLDQEQRRVARARLVRGKLGFS